MINMLSPNIQKIPSNSYIRLLNKSLSPHIYSLQSFKFQSNQISNLSNSSFITRNTPLNSLYTHSHWNFCVKTTKKRQAEILQRQQEMQKEEFKKRQAQMLQSTAVGRAQSQESQTLQAIYPDELSDSEDEYIPEVDWDHTRFESHYKRIWEQEPEPETLREKIYDKILKYFVLGTWIIGGGCLMFGLFAWYKMKRQLKYVRRTQRSIRFMRKIYDKHMNKLLTIVPLNFETMDINSIKNMLLPLCDVDSTHMSVENLNEKCKLWNEFHELELPLNDIIDYEGNGILDIEDVTYFITLLHYFLGQTRRKGTPSVRRQVRDDIYKMLESYSNGNVTLKNMGSYAGACFCLAIISPPNLGDETIGGQTLDEFKVNYCKYMLRDEEMNIDSPVSRRKFNFIYKICDFSVGLTPETRGQLAK